MKYLIGMDGGGTKTACIITDQNGNILHECTGGPSNFLILGTETVSATLHKLITECTEKLKIGYEDLAAIVVGTTGAGRRSDAERLEHAFFEYVSLNAWSFSKLRVESDARIALEGAFSGKPGSILIAGTGSIMFGKNKSDEIFRVGGFGRFFGDEGSGFVLGKKALMAVSRDFDGRGSKTAITELMTQKFGIDSPEKLITEVYKNNFDIASAAPLVIEAADKNDRAALEIIEEETTELALHVSTMYKKLNETVMDLALIGGLITHKNIYSETFRKKIDEIKHINVKSPDYPPAMGAILMAKKLI